MKTLVTIAIVVAGIAYAGDIDPPMKPVASTMEGSAYAGDPTPPDGSACNPYLVETAEDLDNVRNDLDAHYRQVADIDMSSFEDFLPIGDDNIYFTGTFDGHGRTISNLSFTGIPYHPTGLFGFAEGATFLRINLENVDIFGEYAPVGALVGTVIDVVVARCSSSGTVDGGWEVGGLIGVAIFSTVVNSSSSAMVSGSAIVGGLVGLARLSTIHHSHATGDLNVYGAGGGGGLIGACGNLVLTRSYASGDVYSQGGLGHGGLIASATDTDISRCYAKGQVIVEGGIGAGGLVGYLFGQSSVVDSYAAGSVTTGYNVGGLLGHLAIDAYVENSYATGAVTGLYPESGPAGGLVGNASALANVVNSYWDTQSTGQNSSAAGEGRTTAEMTTVPPLPDTYVGWDFDTIWTQQEGYYAALYDPGDEDEGDGGVTICHVPPGNPDNAHTITVSANAVPAHLAHGDYCGPCEDEVADPCADDDVDGRVTICHVPPGNPDNAHTITVGVNAVPAHLAHGDYCGPCEDERSAEAGRKTSEEKRTIGPLNVVSP